MISKNLYCLWSVCQAYTELGPLFIELLTIVLCTEFPPTVSSEQHDLPTVTVCTHIRLAKLMC